MEEPASVALIGARRLLHRFTGYSWSSPRLFTCPFPLYYGHRKAFLFSRTNDQSGLTFQEDYAL